ncbi:hypothetical protein Gorai_005796 [Gossypium raimondii]|uniref:Uncharacterized protein n=1 Tax=Gossypium raimondii TaxID=29730 RepID=A0A7J8QDC3_GOSRA|nr:hypothetical protein [Gossypium raimondii]
MKLGLSFLREPPVLTKLKQNSLILVTKRDVLFTDLALIRSRKQNTPKGQIF